MALKTMYRTIYIWGHTVPIKQFTYTINVQSVIHDNCRNGQGVFFFFKYYTTLLLWNIGGLTPVHTVVLDSGCGLYKNFTICDQYRSTSRAFDVGDGHVVTATYQLLHL